MRDLLRGLLPNRLLERLGGAPSAGVTSRAVADALGLELSPTGLTGEVLGQPIRVQRREDGWCVQVGARRGHEIPAALRIGRAAGGSPLGDEPFDQRVQVLGDRSIALAFCDPERRSALREALGASHPPTRVQGAWCTVELPVSARLHELRHEASRLAALARRLQLPEPSWPDRLADRVRDEPVEAVRHACLHALLDAGHEPSSSRGAAQALRESAPAPRLRAAVYLKHADALTTLVGDPTATPEQVLTALATLASLTLPSEAALRALRAGLERSDPAIQRAALRLAPPLGVDALPLLLPLLDRSLRDWGGARGWGTVSELARALAALLADLGHADTRAPLLALLDAPSNEVRVEALRGLARVGLPSDGPTIQPYRERPFPSVRTAAEQAIAHIEQRIDPARVGALTLTEPSEAGGLSLTDDRSGALSESD